MYKYFEILSDKVIEQNLVGSVGESVVDEPKVVVESVSEKIESEKIESEKIESEKMDRETTETAEQKETQEDSEQEYFEYFNYFAYLMDLSRVIFDPIAIMMENCAMEMESFIQNECFEKEAEKEAVEKAAIKVIEKYSIGSEEETQDTDDDDEEVTQYDETTDEEEILYKPKKD